MTNLLAKSLIHKGHYRALVPLLLLGWLALQLAAIGYRSQLLLLIGTLLGLSLYLSRFSFTGAYRRLLLQRQPAEVIAQLALVALTCLLFAPLLQRGEFAGVELSGAWASVGLQVGIGALIFGIGMQLAGGCGSGTLYTAGGGNPRMLLVLVAFCAGSFWASLDMTWWQSLPSLGVVSLGHRLGWGEAVAVQLSLLLLLAILLFWWGKTAPKGPSLRETNTPMKVAAKLRPLLWGVVLLALLNLATLITAGHPWSITWALSLWGAKAAGLMGWTPSVGSFWTAPFQHQALTQSILEDTTSVMNIGILLGATTAALLSGGFHPSLKHHPRQWLAALFGGLLLGYGARIAYGCNIGAFVSGVASTSLHGWLWILCALPGNWLGIKLRPWFGLSNQ
ncbi:MAG: YeeE/YedE family protein [Motiliproteus sp.]